MPAKPSADREPDAPAALAPFEEGDFRCLAPGVDRDPQFNDRRLVLRRKLLSLAKVFAARAETLGAKYDVRSSLHAPTTFNQMRVRRLWCYATRDKAEKKRLKGVLGSELGKDLDAAYRNAYLCCALEHDALEVSLRIHADAWYDGQNLVKRVAKEGVAPWMRVLNALDGFHLRLADWKGEWRCGALTRESLEDFLRYYKPSEHALAIERRWPAPVGAREALLAPQVPGEVVGEMLRLIPAWRHAAWSAESDHLLSR